MKMIWTRTIKAIRGFLHIARDQPPFLALGRLKVRERCGKAS